MLTSCVSETILHVILGVLGHGTFGTCQAKWYSGTQVAVKTYHKKHMQAKHILMEANMLEVMCIHVYNSIMNNFTFVLQIETQICAGHPNTPQFSLAS